jgi:hypothetical protein
MKLTSVSANWSASASKELAHAIALHALSGLEKP